MSKKFIITFVLQTLQYVVIQMKKKESEVKRGLSGKTPISHY